MNFTVCSEEFLFFFCNEEEEVYREKCFESKLFRATGKDKKTVIPVFRRWCAGYDFAPAPWSDLHIRPGAFLISHKLYCNDKKKQYNSDKEENNG